MTVSVFDDVFLPALEHPTQGRFFSEEAKALYRVDAERRGVGPGESACRHDLGIYGTPLSTASTCDIPEIGAEVKCVHSYGKARRDGTRGNVLVPFMVNGKAVKTWGNATYYMPEKLRHLPPRHLTDAVSESCFTIEVQNQLPRQYLNYLLNRMKPSKVMTSEQVFCVTPYGYIIVPKIDYDLAFSFYVMNPGKPKYKLNEAYLRRLAGIVSAT